MFLLTHGLLSCKHCYSSVSPWLGLTQEHVPVQPRSQVSTYKFNKTIVEISDSTSLSVLKPHPPVFSRSGSELCWPAACASSPPVYAGPPYPATRTPRRSGSSLRTCRRWKPERAAGIGIACLNAYQVRTWKEQALNG